MYNVPFHSPKIAKMTLAKRKAELSLRASVSGGAPQSKIGAFPDSSGLPPNAVSLRPGRVPWGKTGVSPNRNGALQTRNGAPQAND